MKTHRLSIPAIRLLLASLLLLFPLLARAETPSITVQPASRTNNAGTTATFSVTVSGTAPLSYQWIKDGTNHLSDGGRVSGATNATLTVSGVLKADEGSYRVEVTNAEGSDLSSNAVLTVMDPCIMNQPVSRASAVGRTVMFNGGAVGTPPLNYQWRFNGTNLPGANQSLLVLPNVQATNAGSYSVEVTSAAGFDLSSNAVLMVIDPMITRDPAGRTNRAGTTATFSVTVSGTAPLSYQWIKDGTNHLSDDGRVSGATTATLTVSNVLKADEGSYCLELTNASGLDLSSNAVLTVIDPVITTQPASRTNNTGTTATFNVTIIGTAPLSYQWIKNGTNHLSDGDKVSGATNDTLTLSDVTTNEAGSYSVVVTNLAGGVASSNAVLTVLAPPAIVSHPASRTNVAGSAATFTVAASGTAPLRYRWIKDGTNNMSNGGRVSGATTATLTLSNVTTNEAGSYSAVVTNLLGTTASSNAVLMVPVPPVIVSQPASRTNAAGSTATFTVAASGTAPFGYQWIKDGTNRLSNGGRVSGATNDTLTVSNVTTNEAGSYSVVVTNLAGGVTNSDAVLTVIDPPMIITSPASRTNAAGSNATFSVTATGTAPLSYQWIKDGTNYLSDGGKVSGATNTTLTVSGVLKADEGSYSVVLTNWAGLGISSNAVLTVIDPVITNQPASRTNYAGTTATFSVAATGTTPFSYQWKKDGSNLSDGGKVSGTTNDTLSVSNVTTNEAGSYSVVVSNPAGGVASASAVLAVPVSPLIVSHPANQTNNAGTTVAFSVTVSSTAPLSYQWIKDETNYLSDGGRVSGATNDTLTVSGVLKADEGSYRVEVTNVAGLGLSSNAVLTVMDPVITTQPASQTVNTEMTATFSVTASGTAPLSYQWKKNGSNLSDDGKVSGATNDTLTISGVLKADEGSYSVVLTNAVGLDLSSNAVLTVIDPVITTQPASCTNNAGSTATFSVTASGAAPLSYQWIKDETNYLSDDGKVSGATNDTLTVSGVLKADEGSYRVMVVNAEGSDLSSNAVLMVIDPMITAQPASRTNNAGTMATFSVTASGTAPLSYQWIKDGSNLSDGGKVSGATNATLTVSDVTPNEAGSYSVVVTNLAGGMASSNAVLTVPVSIVSHPASRTNNAGTMATFSVTASGAAPLSYQWIKDETNYLSNGGRVTGATNATLTVSGVLKADEGSYRVEVTNAAGLDLSSNAVLTVMDPVIATQPASRTNRAGTTATFSVTATGTAPFSYQWIKDETNHLSDDGRVTGALNATLTVSGVLEADEGSYRVEVTNAAGLVLSSNVVLTVIDPVVTTQPASRTNKAGTTATFSVTATGTAPFSYQWIKDGTNHLSDDGRVSGATNATLTVSNVLRADKGSYRVEVTNAAGLDLSSNAVLTVIDPVITNQPASRTNNAGTMATFSVTIIGTTPLSYQWRKNGSNLSDGGRVTGVTNDTLTLSDVTTNEAGTYSVVVTNLGGRVTSSNAALTVLLPPSIVFHPASRTNNAGSTATFSVTASGAAPLSYQWIKDETNYLSNGDKVSGATTATLTVSGVLEADEGSYRVVVTNVAGLDLSSNAVLTVVDPVITTQPASRTNKAGTKATFSVTVSGTAPLSYQWIKDGTNHLSDGGKVSGATNDTLTVSGVLKADEGSYRVQVTNAAGLDLSSNAVLTVIDPVITAQPASRTNKAGATATFSVTVSGTAPLIYQWLKDGSNLSDDGRVTGATTAKVKILDVLNFDEGSYCVVVTNLSGSATSSLASLTVTAGLIDTNPPTVKIASPSNRSVTTNKVTTISGTAEDNMGVQCVLYSVNNGVWQLASGGVNWTAAATLVDGNNYVTVESLDYEGNVSKPVTNAYFLRVLAPLTLVTNGNGTVTPANSKFGTPTNGATLEIGRNYIVIAVPGTDWLFTNWTASVEGGPTNVVFNSAKYPFPMETNLTLIANFVPNRFLAAAGSYSGLFWDTNRVVAHHSAGFFSLKVKAPSSKLPTFSGRLTVEGQSHGFSGTLDLEGEGVTARPVARPAKSSLAVRVRLPVDGRETVSGSVSNLDNSWVSELSGTRAVFDLTNNPATNYLGSYTLVLPGNGVPGGDGYAVVKVASNGAVNVMGMLGDAQPFKPLATVLSKDGEWAFYAPAYLWTNGVDTNGLDQYAGEILGWLSVSNDAARHVAGDLVWIKTGWTNGYYDTGFTNEVAVLGGSYTPDTNRLVAITNGVVIVNGGNLPADYTNSFVLNAGNKAVITNTPYGQLPGMNKDKKITPGYKTGLIKVTFPNPGDTNVTTTATGVVLQDDVVVRGVFKGLTNEAGSLRLQEN